MNVARSSLKLFGANIGVSVLQFVAIVYFARVLGANSLGIFFLFQALLGMAAIPADFGLRGAVEKRISEGESPGVFLSSTILMKIVPLCLLIFGILLFQRQINGYLGADFAYLLAVAIILQESAQLAIVVLKGELRVGETASLQMIREVTWIGVGAILVQQGFGATGLVYGLLFGLVVVVAVGWFKVSVVPDVPTWSHAHSLFDYGKYNVISSVGGYFYNWMDVTLIGLFLTQSHVGAYEVAWRVTNVVILLSRSIATTIFPQVSQWSAENANDRIEELIPQVIIPSLLLVIPASFGTVLLSDEILGLLFGTEYVIASLALIILMFDQVSEAGQVILGRALQAVNRPDLAARATVIGIVMNLLLNVVLIVWIGITGAALATFLASLVGGLLLHGYFLSTVVTIRVPYRELASCLLASIGMTALLAVITIVIDVDSTIRLFSIVSLGAAIYGVSLLLFPSMRKRIVEQSNTLFN